MMFDLDEEDLKRAAHNLSEAAKKIQDRMVRDTLRTPYSPFVSTGKMMNPFTMRPSIPFRPFVSVPLWNLITSPYVVEKKRRSREVKLTFWQRVWSSLTDLNPWPYSPIEFYGVDVPAIMIDRPNHRIICHPSLEREIKKAVDEGQL